MNKKIILSFILCISFFSLFCNSYAAETSLKYVDVEAVGNYLKGENVSFFVLDFIENENGNFGIQGAVQNLISEDYEYTLNILYYNEDYKLVAESKQIHEINSSDYTKFKQIQNYSTINYGYTVEDIKYYTFKIIETNVKVTNNNITNISNKYKYKDYVINNYEVEIKVNENNLLNIKENITAYFNVPKHGIYRTIPKKNHITRLDGTSSKNIVNISNIQVNDNFTKESQGNNLLIKIGSSDILLTGEQNYQISYDYNLGKDTGKGYDELYYNIIGNEWDTVIGGVTFKIIMPKEFDKSKLGFSAGKYGSIDSNNIEYTVDGNVITGKYKGILNEGEGLTVRLELEEGYFTKTKLNVDIVQIILFVIPLLGFIICINLWKKYGKDVKPIETVEFYPPNGLNSLDVAYIYKDGKFERSDVMSLIVYLASSGYLKIEEYKKQTMFGEKEYFKITQIKEYDKSNYDEARFLSALFEDSSINEEGLKYITSESLKENFTITESITEIIKQASSNKKEKIFKKKNKAANCIQIIMLVIAILLTTLLPGFSYSGMESLVLMLPILLVYTPFYIILFVLKMSKITKIIYAIFIIAHSSVFIYFSPLFECLSFNTNYIIPFIIAIICIVGMIFCIKNMSKRNNYGNEILGKILGFRRYLIAAEKEELEQRVWENPEYFYNILPYTYVLGISDKWIEKFELIDIIKPNWYNGTSDFSVKSFGEFMNSTIKSVTYTVTPSGSGGGGSSSSGGGSSGGGSGGGGGGSW